MSKTLGQDPAYDMLVGTRDALHVPIIVATFDDYKQRCEALPGRWVKFVDADFTKIQLSDKEDGHGIIDPFLDEVGIDVVVLLKPGITSPVRHQFEINTNFLSINRMMLEAELAEAKADDPDCAECWEIQNGKVIRN